MFILNLIIQYTGSPQYNIFAADIVTVNSTG